MGDKCAHTKYIITMNSTDIIELSYHEFTYKYLIFSE